MDSDRRSSQKNETSSSLDDATKKDEGLLDYLDILSGDNYAVAVFFWLLFLAVAAISSVLLLSLPWLAALATGFMTFVIYRHQSLKRNHPKPPSGRGWVSRPDPNRPVPDLSGLPAVYFLYVLGSGGHTAEMIETIKQKFRGLKNQHRRYIITSGDEGSLAKVKNLEAIISDAYPDERKGTRDVFKIKRARAVHQSIYTAPFTCLISAAHAVNALTREPNLRPVKEYGYQFKYPHVIVTNGPATGFIVGLVAHLLKILYLAPSNRLKIVYIESWARTQTLSLTGKLFLRTGIANVFGVQHEPLARKIPGAQYVGQVTARLTPVG